LWWDFAIVGVGLSSCCRVRYFAVVVVLVAVLVLVFIVAAVDVNVVLVRKRWAKPT